MRKKIERKKDENLINETEKLKNEIENKMNSVKILMI